MEQFTSLEVDEDAVIGRIHPQTEKRRRDQ